MAEDSLGTQAFGLISVGSELTFLFICGRNPIFLSKASSNRQINVRV